MTTYTLFTGFIESWQASWEGAHRRGNDRVSVTAVDGMKLLNLATLTLTRSQESSGDRITALLDAISWPSDLRDIDEGVSQVQAVTLENANVLAHIQEVAASESGQFFMSVDGKATFHDRHHTTLLEEEEDTWGDSGDEKRFATLTPSYDDQTLWNKVTVTAPDLTDQTAEDPTSIAQFGGITEAPRSLTVNTLLTTTGEMFDRAEFYISKYAFPELRIVTLEIDQASLDDEQWQRILMKELLDRILVIKRPEGDILSQPSFVEGITIRNDAGHWRFTWNLSSTALQQGQWELGTVGLSELEVTTTLVG